MKAIPDILRDLTRLRVILILESPYKDELVHGHPLAGLSGQAITNYVRQRVSPNSQIRGFTNALGCELVRGEGVNGLGVMNASLWPLDRNCYPCQMSGRTQQIVDAFDLIRANPTVKTKRRDRLHRRVEGFLRRGFHARVRAVLDTRSSANVSSDPLVFVPCGELADVFLASYDLPQEQRIPMLPHPSRNGWTNLESSQFDDQLSRL